MNSEKSDRTDERVTAGSGSPQESGRLQQLRERAQAALSHGAASAAPLGAAIQAEVGALIEELRVYQAELEIQNQELSAAQQRTESLRDRFTQLFTALPLPALVVDERGVVCEANREARRLFAIGGRAGGRSIHRLLADRDDSALGRLLEAVRHGDEPRSSPRSVGFRTVESDDHPFLIHAIEVHDDGQTSQVELLLVDQTGPKRIEAQRLALERQAERFLRAQQAADIGTWEWDVVADRIAWDATALGLLGLTPERAMFDNAAWRALVHPVDLPGIVERYGQDAQANDRFDNEARYRHADGRWIWLHVTGRVLARDTSGAPTRLSGILRNIDAEQRAREAAEAASMRLQRFAERAPGAFHQIIRTTDGRSRLTFAGGHFAAVFGVDAQAAIADDRTIRTRVDPTDLAALERAIDDAGRHEAVVRMEFRITDADGTQRWLETESSPEPLPDGSVLWHGFTRDVTQRRRLADAEREARQRLQLACDIADIGIWSWDPGTGRIEWDERMYRWYAIPAEIREAGIAYEIWRDRLHPDDREGAERWLEDVLSDAGTQASEHVYRILLPGPEVRVIHSALHVARAADGTARRVVGVNRDVTELRRAETGLITAKESAEAADAAKGRFLANVGHEVRTPLNAMLGLAGVLLEEPLTPRQRERIEKMRIAGAVLMETLNDILDQSKIEAGMMRIESAPLRIRALLQRCRDLFDLQAEARGVRLEVATADDVPAVLVGDPLRLQQALGNLVGNALKFTDCGEVRVEVTCADHDADAVTLRISVTDTGIGLTPEELEGLFAAFHQSDSSISRRYGGTGLGLSIAKRLAELMGGSAGARSTAGQGSTFWFTARLRIAPDDTVVEPPMVRGPRATLAVPEAASVDLPTPAAAVDPEALQPRLLALERQLSAGRVDARTTAAEIGKLLAGTRLQPRWTAIARAVTGFDFSAALDRLRALSEEEGWNPTQHPGH